MSLCSLTFACGHTIFVERYTDDYKQLLREEYVKNNICYSCQKHINTQYGNTDNYVIIHLKYHDYKSYFSAYKQHVIICPNTYNAKNKTICILCPPVVAQAIRELHLNTD